MILNRLAPPLTQLTTIHHRLHRRSTYHHHAQGSSCIFELPEACRSDSWHHLLHETRGLLSRERVVKNGGGACGAPLNYVVQRLQGAANSSEHLIDTFKQLLDNTDLAASSVRWPGIVSLMVSKIAGNPFLSDNFISKAVEDLVWATQITLAEVLNLLHGNLAFQQENLRLESTKTLKSNKLTYVKSDVGKLANAYFVSTALYKMAAINNCKVAELISSVLQSMAKARALGSNSGSDWMPIRTLDSWERETFNPQGVLLANGCQAALELAGHDDGTQRLAFEFGRNFAFALRANSNIHQFLSYQTSQCSSIHLNSFPVVIHFAMNPESLVYMLSCKDRLDNLDFDVLNSMIKSSNALEVSKQHLSTYINRSMCHLKQMKNFKDSAVTPYLVRLIDTLENIPDKY